MKRESLLDNWWSKEAKAEKNTDSRPISRELQKLEGVKTKVSDFAEGPKRATTIMLNSMEKSRVNTDADTIRKQSTKTKKDLNTDAPATQIASNAISKQGSNN